MGVVVVVTKVGGGSENGGSDRSQDGGRGCGARARRLMGGVVCPLPSAAWPGKRELQVPAGGAWGWWRGPLCEGGRAKAMERGLLCL